jgi:hypothetical protein
MLGSPIGTRQFALDNFNNIGVKIENDLSLLKSFPHLHQRTKLLTFNINTRLNYFLRTTPPEISSTTSERLDTSVDEFWAHTLHFPTDYKTNQYASSYTNALQQIRLGIRDGGCGCYHNKHFVHAAYYTSVADTIQWLQPHPLNPTWLCHPISQTLDRMLDSSIHQLQLWNIPLAETLPPVETRTKTVLPLAIPVQPIIPTWRKELFPTQGDFGRHIKKQLKTVFLNNIAYSQRNRVQAVGRNQFKLHKRSHLNSTQPAISQLWQCSTSLFSLTSFQELSNEAFLTSTSLLLGLPVPHARYLQATQPLYANTDIWADNLLNKSAHAAETRKTTHTQFAQELTRIANECGIPTTCNESRIPYRDEGQNHQSRKRADMMTLTGCGISPNLQLNLHSSTKLVMDVTIGHTYNMVHDFKPNNLRTMETTKRYKYDYHYLRQRLAFAPMVANTLGQCGPDLLQFLWNLADHHTRLNLGFSIETTNNLSTQQSMDYRKLRGLKYHENRLRILTCVFEAAATRVFGSTFHLTCSPAYHGWLNNIRHNWLPLLPTTDPTPPASPSQSPPPSNSPPPPPPSYTPQPPSNDSPLTASVPQTDETLALTRVGEHRRRRSILQDPQDPRPSQRQRTLSSPPSLTSPSLSPHVDREHVGAPAPF